MRIILASQSPRRRELLERMGIFAFEVIPARGEEVVHPGLAPARLVEELSRQKCDEVAAAHPEALVIAADTVVSIDGRILGKPRSPAAAAEISKATLYNYFSSKEDLLQGIADAGLTVRCGGQAFTEHEATSVRFRTLSAGEIERYVGTGEPMDKAGAYGIQGYGSVLVEGISGDYYNVVGLPVCRLARLLARFGVDPLALAAEKEQGT